VFHSSRRPPTPLFCCLALTPFPCLRHLIRV
jgi:hypothetical protein